MCYKRKLERKSCCEVLCRELSLSEIGEQRKRRICVRCTKRTSHSFDSWYWYFPVCGSASEDIHVSTDTDLSFRSQLNRVHCIEENPRACCCRDDPSHSRWCRPLELRPKRKFERRTLPQRHFNSHIANCVVSSSLSRLF